MNRTEKNGYVRDTWLTKLQKASMNKICLNYWSDDVLCAVYTLPYYPKQKIVDMNLKAMLTAAIYYTTEKGASGVTKTHRRTNSDKSCNSAKTVEWLLFSSCSGIYISEKIMNGRQIHQGSFCHGFEIDSALLVDAKTAKNGYVRDTYCTIKIYWRNFKRIGGIPLSQNAPIQIKIASFNEFF